MIGPIIPEAYDFEGTETLIPTRGANRVFHPTFPMGRFLSQPLTVRCKDISDIRAFLATCRWVSDKEQFGRNDYWLPPEEFEKTRQGDCEDFALWSWRQFMDLGIPARLVVGYSGRYGEGHAWLHAEIGGTKCLIEPQHHWIRRPLPRLSTLRYQPQVSVAWDGKQVRYFKHRKLRFEHRMRDLPPLIIEWLKVWVPLWANLPAEVARRVRKRGGRTSQAYRRW